AGRARPVLVPRPGRRLPVPDPRSRPGDDLGGARVRARLAVAAHPRRRAGDLGDLRGDALAARRGRLGWPARRLPGAAPLRRDGDRPERQPPLADAPRRPARPMTLPVLAIGLNHASAPIEVRERLAVEDAGLPAALADLLAATGLAEALLIATCNRVEVWGVERGVDASGAVTSWLAARAGTPAAELGRLLCARRGLDAV